MWWKLFDPTPIPDNLIYLWHLLFTCSSGRPEQSVITGWLRGAASFNWKRDSCQNNTHSAREQSGRAERERRCKDEEEEEEGKGILRCTETPPAPGLLSAPSLPQSGNPQRFWVETRSLISSLHVVLGCPSLIILLIILPFYSKNINTTSPMSLSVSPSPSSLLSLMPSVSWSPSFTVSVSQNPSNVTRSPVDY